MKVKMEHTAPSFSGMKKMAIGKKVISDWEKRL
jgi:hypothetical protein